MSMIQDTSDKDTQDIQITRKRSQMLQVTKRENSCLPTIPPENAKDNAKNDEDPAKDDQHKWKPVEAKITSLKI